MNLLLKLINVLIICGVFSNAADKITSSEEKAVLNFVQGLVNGLVSGEVADISECA